jgi:hypothetical protein
MPVAEHGLTDREAVGGEGGTFGICEGRIPEGQFAIDVSVPQADLAGSGEPLVAEHALRGRQVIGV